MITDRDAPRNRIVALHAISGTTRELVAERGDQLESATVAGGRLLVQWLQDAAGRLSVHNLDGTELAAVTLPGLVSITGMEARPTEPIAHLAWTAFHEPPAVLLYDTSSGELTTAFRAELSSDLVTEQRWVTSTDGTRLPMFLVHRPDVTRKTNRTRPGCTATAVSGSRSPPTSSRRDSPSPAPAGSLPSPACAAAVNTARRGTTPAGSPTSRTSLRT
jgi:prolyl oligopeptidase